MSNDELFRAAVKAAEKSYSKYSGFSVGAALLTADGMLSQAVILKTPLFH